MVTHMFGLMKRWRKEFFSKNACVLTIYQSGYFNKGKYLNAL